MDKLSVLVAKSGEDSVSLDGKLGLCCWAEASWDLDSDVHHAALDEVRFAALIF